ncbi:clavaldehyde dehydrogenase [Vibrio breoganii]|uniref:SDR family oxidoreductase n=1 Tax=Vibrio breoganii TaxID=553239 RepID=UPI000C8391E8|nr:SDR family oxidoreductase [Vibrio breoganii]PMO99170.1 clavaldehyde dehydrogenase [Vibrio breoganii]
MRILLTGAGDLAHAIYGELKEEYEVFIPERNELDVTNEDSVRNYMRISDPHVVVNLAGTLYSSTIEDSISDFWIRDIKVNLIGTYLVSKYTLLNNRKSRIINVSSTAAYNSYFDWTSYCAAKAGVLKVSNGLALQGYDVISICPGAIETKIRDGLNINNTNVMTVQEGIMPIIDSIEGKYNSGDIVFYRKGEIEIRREI